MYYGSDEFNNAIENTQGNALKTRLKFSDEEIIELASSMRYYGGSNDSDDLSIGNVVSAYVEVSAFTNEMLTGREFLLESGVKLSDGTYEYAPIGYFTVQTPNGDYDEVSFTAYDRMIKFEKVYNSSLTYPTDSAAVLDELCTMCGVALATPITNPITITENLKGYTCREVLGYIAGIHGFFACIDRYGELNLCWYSDTPIEKSLRYVWAFEKSQEQYEVEKVEVAKNSETAYTSGTGIITLYHSNPYATQEIANSIYASLGSYTYMPAEIEMLDDIRLDPWDVVQITYFDNQKYLIPAMVIQHDFGASCTIVKAVGKLTESEYHFTGPTTNYLNRMSADLLIVNRILATKVDAEYVKAHAITTDNLDAIEANIKKAVIDDMSVVYANINLANIDVANIDKANIGMLFNEVGLITDATIVDGHVTGYLDAVEVNANNITAGTLAVDRLIFRGGENSIVYELNNITGALQAVQGDTLNGEILTDRSITVDKIVAKSITANEIATATITGNEIASNTITANNIKTNTITANKLLLGDFTNYATVNENYPDSAIPQATYGGAIINDGYVVKTDATTSYLMLCDYTPSCLMQNDEIYYELSIKSEIEDGKVRVCLWVYGENNSYLGRYNGSYITTTTVDTVVSGSIVLNSELVNNAKSFIVGIQDASSTKGQLYLKNIRVSKKTGANLIVDGSITAEKLNVNAIKSLNYVKDNTGSFLNLADGAFDSKYLKWDEYGNITAESGQLAQFVFDDMTMTCFVDGDVENAYIKYECVYSESDYVYARNTKLTQRGLSIDYIDDISASGEEWVSLFSYNRYQSTFYAENDGLKWGAEFYLDNTLKTYQQAHIKFIPYTDIPIHGISTAGYLDITADLIKFNGAMIGNTLKVDTMQTTQGADLDKVYNKCIQRRFILVGDSYLKGHNPDVEGTIVDSWGVQLSQMLPQYTFNIQFISGSGFGNTNENKNFLGALKAYSGDKNIITDILVCGGYNDVKSSITSTMISTGMSNFMTYAKENFPNAKIHIGFCGACSIGTAIHNIKDTVIMYQACGNWGAGYISNMEYAAKHTRFLSSDKVHPNALGQKQIAWKLASYLTTGNASVIQQRLSCDIVLADTVTSGITLYTSMDNEIASLYHPAIETITFSGLSSLSLNSKVANRIHLGTLTNSCIIGNQSASTVTSSATNAILSIPVLILLEDSTAGYINGIGTIEIMNLEVYLRLGALGSNGIYTSGIVTNVIIPPFTVTFDSLDV